MSNVPKKSAEKTEITVPSETESVAAPPAARRRAAELASEIARHERLYYGEGRPEITDSDFDALLRELVALEEKYPVLVTPDSPTRRVGGAPTESFATVSHTSPMLSLENAYSWEEAQAWLGRLKRALKGEEPSGYVAELKIDGLSISLRYEKGLLGCGATRGDGFRGDDVTGNVRTIRSIPLSIAEKGRFEARGEVYYPKKGEVRAFGTANRIVAMLIGLLWVAGLIEGIIEGMKGG